MLGEGRARGGWQVRQNRLHLLGQRIAAERGLIRHNIGCERVARIFRCAPGEHTTIPVVVHDGGCVPAGEAFALGSFNIPAVGNEQARNAAVHTQMDFFQRLFTRTEGPLLIEMVAFGEHHRGHVETGIYAPENCFNQSGAFGQPIARRPGELKVGADSGLGNHALLVVRVWLPHEVTHRLKAHPLTAHIEHDSEAAGDAGRGGIGGEIHSIVAVLGRLNLVIPVQKKPGLLTIGAANVKFARYDAFPRLLRGADTFSVIHRNRPRRKSHSIGAVGHSSLGLCCARERLAGLCGWVRVRYRGLCARPAAEENALLRGVPPWRPTSLRIPFATGKTLGAPHATQSAARRAQ